jgi:hypothetical protein
MAQELMIDVHRDEIEISVRGTCLKMTCRKSKAPWGLTCTELRAEDPEAIFTRDEFKTLAWTTANAKARNGLDCVSPLLRQKRAKLKNRVSKAVFV